MSKEIGKSRKISRRVRLIGSDKKNVFNSRREGKDVKRLETKSGIAPLISINASKIVNLRGQKINFFDPSSLGLGQNIISERINSFKDFPDIDPVFLIQNGGPYEAFPFVYDGKQNNDRYRELDELAMDGVIEVFPIRKERMITDIEVTGIKAAIGSGDFIKTANTTMAKKGSTLFANQEEIEKKSHDFFEDSQDLLFANTTFPSVGNSTDTGKKFASEGYTSTGKYTLSPYKEADVFSGSYTHLDEASKTNLLFNSRRNVSDIGTRFNSAANGFIIAPFSNSTEKKRLNTDSIAFIGLRKG